MSEERIGVIGAGVMGAGVAQCLAETGHSVILVDKSQAALDGALKGIERALRVRSMFGGSDARPPKEVLSRIRTTLRLPDVAAAGYIIENVTENVEIKTEVYRELGALCATETVVAANTSAISITRIASWIPGPGRVIGIHFMNPVPMKKTVEVIRGFHTTDQASDQTFRLLEAMGKDWVAVKDAPGFVSNRVLMLTINEAIFLVHEGTAAAEDVDRVFKGCFGHPMGPLETADLIGIDTILFSLEVLQESYGDPKFRPCPLLKKMVDAGLHGRKTGRGFYEYPI